MDKRSEDLSVRSLSILNRLFLVNGARNLQLRMTPFSRGCLGCCTKPTPIIAVDEPSKGLRIQGRTVKKPSISEDFWSTSTCEIDNSTLLTLLLLAGLLLWNQTRLQWVGNKRSENQSQQIREPRLRWNATYEGLLGTNRRFSQPIPLSEMIDFLVDVWEQEGMYD
ncbi:hypothetical protein CK203_013205 [Vitis vinifera]|uniref:Gag1-like clamp domain-containing protein n=1 Tax=Vitis vinifera TaxID=29760 RepID=A0A438C0P0_VITVI|nr:hypothetical protein CK203_076415 [Vitis vinifera]RVX11142.1 hypothetical protein CK203_013205 [Vitis vinifera]